MKSQHNFKVIRQNGEEYDLSELGILTNSFIIDAPITKHYRDVIGGRDGFVDNGTTYDGRTMRARCTMIANDFLDYDLLRNEIFKLFDSKESFYIVRDSEPGKRWLVKYDGTYSMARLTDVLGEFEIPFISPSAYAESIGTTLDPKTFGVGLWQVGQGLIADETMYTHTTNSFSIYNVGDVEINPRFIPLAIIYQGASENLKLRNETNGTEWQYTGTTVSTDTITLDGIRSLKNGVSIFGDTNRKLITLEKGRNDFTLTGASGSFSISFDFRFYTL